MLVIPNAEHAAGFYFSFPGCSFMYAKTESVIRHGLLLPHSVRLPFDALQGFKKSFKKRAIWIGLQHKERLQ
jgi:hypothetical protein